MTILEAIVLGLIQGLTEFIPVSSTAHLRLVPALLGWKDPGAAASAVIQLGTLLAVVVYFAGDCWRMTVGFVRGLVTRRPFSDADSRLAWYVGLGTVPIVVIGLAFKDFIRSGARGLWIISIALVALALVLWLAEAVSKRRLLRPMGEMTLRDAILMGLGQTIALIPGCSRSGSTIMTGLFIGLSREAAARFSFLLSIPAVFGSGLFELVDERHHLAALGWQPIAVAIAVSAVSGWVSIWFLLRYLRTHTTHLFIWYRIVVGVAMMVLLSRGVIAN
ncbi:MAG: undecaprenyl-diphosphate phosphatase [Thermoanaerobaculia bacterium]|jgi:undecaprenyl-diphosphatase